MKSTLLLFAIILLSLHSTYSQSVSIGENFNPNNKAALHINSNDKGLLIPRLTPGAISTYESTLTSADVGMLIYNSFSKQFMYYNADAAKFVNLSNALIDSDGDTFVALDQTLDDDNIVLQTRGITALTIETNNFGYPIFNTRNLSNSFSGMGSSLLFTNQLPSGSGGNFNTFFGNRDSTRAIDGNQNSAFGYNVLNENSSGLLNTGVGYNSLKSNKTGSSNVALGANSLAESASGGSNTAVGFSALNQLENGTSNVAIGSSALNQLSGSNQNVSIGSNAASSMTSGTRNVMLGNNAMLNLDEGNDNIAIGYNSGLGIINNPSTDARSSNIYIGAYAGQDNQGDGNIFIGNFAGRYYDSSNKLVIMTNTSNSGLIYGDLLANKIGINWTFDEDIPAKFAVNGDVYVDDVLRLKPKSTAPTCSASKEGSLYYNGSTKKVYVCTGAVWSPLN